MHQLKPHTLGLVVLLSVGLISTTFAQEKDGGNWPSFRGPNANGTSSSAKPPTEWSETKNVKWKVDIPGSCNSSPIVWGDKVIVLTAVPKESSAAPEPEDRGDRRRRRRRRANMSEHTFKVICLNRKDGKKIWEKTATTKKPHEGHHGDGSYASASPVTDGKHIFAHFGSRGLYCYDMDGNLKWKRDDLGTLRMRNGFGEGSSPTLHKDTLFVPWDHEGQSLLYAIDKKTGKTKWKAKRDEPSNWCSPIVVKAGDKWIVAQAGQNKCRGYDYESGKELWSWRGLTDRPCATPVATDKIVVFSSARRGPSMAALKFSETGDLNSNEGAAWTLRRSTPDIPSLLLVGENLYFVGGNTNVFSGVNVNTGKALFETRRLPNIRSVYSSPVYADGKIFVTSRDGKTVVIDKDQKVISENSLDDRVDATLALAGNEIFIRGKKKLYCIGKK